MNRCFLFCFLFVSYPSSLGGVYQPARIKVIHTTLRNPTNLSGDFQDKNETAGHIYIKTRSLCDAQTRAGESTHTGPVYTRK